MLQSKNQTQTKEIKKIRKGSAQPDQSKSEDDDDVEEKVIQSREQRILYLTYSPSLTLPTCW
jgi:hypothetical protein